MKYYKIEVKCGHVGAGNYRIITFFIEAKDYKDAINQVLAMPGVKHDCNTAIHSLKAIKYDEYIKGRESSAYDNKSMIEKFR